MGIMGARHTRTEQENFASDMSDNLASSINEARNQVMLNNSIAAVNKNTLKIRLQNNPKISVSPADRQKIPEQGSFHATPFRVFPVPVITDSQPQS